MTYSQEELIRAINQLSQENEQLKSQSSDLHRAATSSIHQIEQNLIEWQLDLSKELELIGHQLRGHVIKRDTEGNEDWAEPTKIIEILDENNKVIGEKEIIDEDRKLLNEKGAQEVEKIIRNYLNRNTLLSNFDKETINQRVLQFAHRLRRFLYFNYEEFGLDTNYKIKHFEMIVMNIVDMIEAAYMRALEGGERESLRTARQVTQNISPTGQTIPQGYQPLKTSGGSRWNPVNWFKG